MISRDQSVGRLRQHILKQEVRTLRFINSSDQLVILVMLQCFWSRNVSKHIFLVQVVAALCFPPIILLFLMLMLL